MLCACSQPLYVEQSLSGTTSYVDRDSLSATSTYHQHSLPQSTDQSVDCRRPQLTDWPCPISTDDDVNHTRRPSFAAVADAVHVRRLSTSSADCWRPTTFGDAAADTSTSQSVSTVASGNHAVVHSRLRPRCVTHHKYS